MDEMTVELVAGYRQGRVTGHVIVLPRDLIQIPDDTVNHAVYRVHSSHIRLCDERQLEEYGTIYVKMTDFSAIIGTGWEPDKS
jgi:hypothetical protein